MAATVELEGAPNFRDLGGHDTADGRRVRRGLLYRSEGLCHLTDADLATISGLRIRTVCDLRSRRETRLHPSRWPDDCPCAVEALPILADARAANAGILDIVRADPTAAGARAMMARTYRELPHSAAPALARIVATILDETDGLPLLFHCTAGKDRTGFVAAMLLTALGVPRATIDADYLLSDVRVDHKRLAKRTAEVMAALLGTPAAAEIAAAMTHVEQAYLDAAFAEIAASFGTADTYLERLAGLDPARRARLQARLLEGPPA